MYVRNYRIMRDHKTELETSMIGIQFVITQQHFIHGKLKVNMNATIFFREVRFDVFDPLLPFYNFVYTVKLVISHGIERFLVLIE